MSVALLSKVVSYCLLILLITWAIYRWRLEQTERRLAVRGDERVRECARAARQLHDNLLQGLVAVSLQLEVAKGAILLDVGAKPLVQQALDRLRQLTDASRQAVERFGMQRSEAQSLERALLQISIDLAPPQGIRSRLVVEGAPRALRPLIGDEVYRIASAALASALRHSQASAVETVIEYARDHLRLLIRDDGRGIGTGKLRTDLSAGLSGIASRAARIRARLMIRSAAGVGTEVDLLVPGATAFKEPARRRYRGWLDRMYPRCDSL
jgi:signal transduction histidine kinase